MRTRHVFAPVLSALLVLSLIAPAAPAAALTSAQLPARWVGYYVPGSPLSLTPISTLESKTRVPAAVENYFQDISGGFTAVQAGNAANHGAIPLVTLEFWNGANGVNQPAYSLKRITGGALDAYLHSFARATKSFGREIWLRPFHEMNGNWYPWGGSVNGNTPADFVPAWRHVRNIFTAEGATNVKFVWCPNAESVPNTYANGIARYWPGDAYVDRIAIDGYNFGGSTSTWRSFSSVFGGAYAAVTPLSSKPVFIAETACGTVGGDKAAWIADMFRTIPVKYPRITGVTWFNTVKERDWRIESSSASLSSFQSGLVAWGLAPAVVAPAGNQTAVSMGTSAAIVRVGATPVLSGAVAPSQLGGVVGVYVMRPARTTWSYSSNRGVSATGAWSYGYYFRAGLTPGLYRFKAVYSAASGYLPSSSRVVSITLR